MAVLKLFNVVAQQKLVPNAQLKRNSFELPSFTSGDKWTIEYQALAGIGAPYEVLDVATYTLEIGIYASDGTTQLAYQNTFTADGQTNTYVGQLNCTDAAFINAVSGLTAGGEPLTAYLQIKFVDSTGRPHTGIPVNTPVYLYKTLIPVTGGTTTPPSETPTSEERVRAMAVMMEDTTGTPRIEKSITGLTSWRVYRNDNGAEVVEKIT